MARRLEQVRRLSPREAWLLLQAAIMLPLAGLTPTSLASSNDDPDVRTRALGTARLVGGAASVSPLPTTCLSRSLTLWWILRRQGIASELRIGVSKDDGEFAAHAWVELDGIPINNTPETLAPTGLALATAGGPCPIPGHHCSLYF